MYGVIDSILYGIIVLLGERGRNWVYLEDEIYERVRICTENWRN